MVLAEKIYALQFDFINLLRKAGDRFLDGDGKEELLDFCFEIARMILDANRQPEPEPIFD